MSVDITSIVIQVKSDGIDSATKSLNNLADAAGRAEGASNNLGVATKKTSSTYAEGVLATDKLLAQYQKQVDLLGSNTSQQYAYSAALKGANQTQIQAAMALGAQVDAYKRLATDQAEAIRMNKQYEASLNNVTSASGHASSGTSGITREILVLGHEMSQGQFNRFAGSMMVLAERVDLTAGASGALSKVWAGMGPILSLIINPITILVALLGTGLVTWYHSISAIHDFNKELILTGNSAGTTGDQLYGMADKIGRSIGDARKAVSELAATGRFSVEQINSITEAAVGLSVYGGQSIDTTVKQFEKLAKEPLGATEKSFHNVSKAALELDQQLHFLEPTSMQAILDNEALGKNAEASAIAIKALSDVEKDRTEELKQNMTWLGEKAHELSAGFTNMWNSLWVKQPVVNQLAKLNEELAKITPEQMKGKTGQLKAENLQNQIADIVGQMSEDQVKADTKAHNAAINSAANIAKVWTTSIKERAKGDTMYQQMLEKNLQMEAALREVNSNDELLSTENMEKRRLDIKKLYADKVAKLRAEGTSGIDAELRQIQASSEWQKDDLKSQVKVLDDAYKAKKISVFDYVDQKNSKLQEEKKVSVETYTAEVEALLSWANESKRTLSERNIASGKIQELSKQYIKQLASENDAIAANGSLVTDIASKTADAQATADAKVIESLKDSVAAVQAKNDAYNRLPASVRAVGITEKQIQDDITQSYINNMQAEVDQLIANNNVEDPLIKARLELLRQEIQLKNNLKDAQVEQESIQATNKAIQDYNTAWKQANKQIGDDLASAIIDGGGKGWKKLIKDMELAFAKMVLQPILSPISNGLSSLVTPTAALASGASGGGALGSIGAASGLAGISGSVAAGAGWLTGSTTLGGSLGAAGSLFGTGTLAGATAGAGMVIGALAPIALGIAAVVKLLDNGKESNTRLQFANNNAAGNISINERGNQGQSGSTYIGNNGTSALGTFGVNSTFWMNADQKVVQDFISGVSKSDDALAQFLTTTEKANVALSLTGKTYQANTGAEGDNPNGSGQLDKVYTARIHDIMEGVETGLSSLTDSFAGTSDQLGMEAQALLQYRQALRDSGEAVFGVKVTLQEVASLKLPTESASAALIRVTTAFTATNSVLAAMGKTSEEAFGQVGLASYDLRQSLITAAGGADKLVSSVSAFSEGFLTEAEKIAPVQKQLSESFTALGYSADTTKDQYKDLVTSQDLSTEAGQKMYVSLLGLAPAVLQVADNMQLVSDKSKELNLSRLSALANAEIDSNGPAHQNYLNEQRKEELDALIKISPALADMQREIYSITDASVVAAKSLDIANQRRQLEIALLNAEGYSVEATAMSREDEVAALKKVGSNLAALKQQAFDAADALEISNKKHSLELSMIDAIGNQVDILNAKRKDELETLGKISPILADMQKKIYAFVDALAKVKLIANTDFNVLSASIDSQKKALQSSYNDQATLWKQQKDAAKSVYDAFSVTNQASLKAEKEFNTSVTSLANVLDSTLSTLLDTEDLAQSRQAAQKEIFDALDKTLATGVLPTADALKSSLKTITKPSDKLFSSYADYLKDLGITAGKVSQLKDITDKAKSVSDLQLDTLQASLDQAKLEYDATVNGIDTAETNAKAQLDSQLQQLDLVKEYAQKQLDAMNGTQIAVLSVASALAAFNTSVNAAIKFQQGAGITAQSGQTVLPGQQSAPASASTEQIKNLYQTLLGRSADSQGLSYYQDLASKGYTASQLAQYFMASPEYQSINGSHANGLDNVPFDGYTAKLHKGEMVLPAKQAQGVAQSSDYKSLLEEVKKLREDNSAENQSMATNITILRKLFQNMTPSGDRLQTYEIGAPT